MKDEIKKPGREMQYGNSRKDYLDVLRFIGIFSIYLGHFATSAGRLYPFVFIYHVPLFFFLSGCTETIGRKRGYLDYFIHKVKTIIFPWLFFAIASVALVVVNAEPSLSEVKQYCIQILQGCVRNQFLAGGLWFLTCLFVVSIFFRIIENQRKVLVFAICLVIYIASQKLVPHSLPGEPSWYWNIDSAMYYLLYYCIGFLVFPSIERILEKKSRICTGLKLLIWILCGIYTILCYFGTDSLTLVWAIPYIGALLTYIRPLIIITWFFGIAYCLRDFKLLQKIGKDTLYLCGSEMIIKTIVPSLVSIIGLEINLASPLSAILYTGILLFVTDWLLVPAEKQLLSVLG